MKKENVAGGMCVFAGLVAIIGSAKPLSYGIERHWNMADSLGAYLGTLQTYLSEIFLETDFIGLKGTFFAWWGLLLIGIGLWIAFATTLDSVDPENIQEEEDHGTAQ